MYAISFSGDYKDSPACQEYLRTVFSPYDDRLLVDWSYITIDNVISICEAQGLDGYGGRTLRELRAQREYMGRIFFGREISFEATSALLGGTLPGENTNHPNSLLSPRAMLILQSASDQRRLRAELSLHSVNAVDPLTDAGYSVALDNSKCTALLHWETREPRYTRSKHGWESRTYKGLVTWGESLSLAFTQGGFNAVWTAMEGMWTQIVGLRPRTVPISQANMMMRWRLHHSSHVMAFCLDGSRLQGVLTDLEYSSGGLARLVMLDEKQVEISSIYELLPYPAALK